MSKTLIQAILGDTGDLAEWSEDKLDPDDLKRLSEEPASVLWVVRFVRRAHVGCWVARWVRNFRLWLAIAIGISIAALSANAVALFALRASLRESQRETTIQTLRELKILSAAHTSATGESVATLLGGFP